MSSQFIKCNNVFQNRIINSNKNQSTIPENSMRKSCASVMCRYRADSFAFAEEVRETKLKTVSTKLSELPHHTAYHTKHLLSGIPGCPTYPMPDISGCLTYPAEHTGVLNLPLLGIPGCLTYPS